MYNPTNSLKLYDKYHKVFSKNRMDNEKKIIQIRKKSLPNEKKRNDIESSADRSPDNFS